MIKRILIPIIYKWAPNLHYIGGKENVLTDSNREHSNETLTNTNSFIELQLPHPSQM